VFERFTANARQVIVLALGHVRELRHRTIEPDHLLLGLLSLEHGVAHDALLASGLTLADARAEIVRVRGEGTAPSPSDLPFSAAAKGVLEASVGESNTLAHPHPYIGSEHLLLALLSHASRLGDVAGLAGRDIALLRRETLQLLARGVPFTR
jgi:ATP-dependent Clp protease ATP-binding subunit ClpA